MLASRPRLDVIGTTIGPFLGVYALWGLVEEQVRDIYFVNIALHGAAAATTGRSTCAGSGSI